MSACHGLWRESCTAWDGEPPPETLYTQGDDVKGASKAGPAEAGGNLFSAAASQCLLRLLDAVLTRPLSAQPPASQSRADPFHSRPNFGSDSTQRGRHPPPRKTRGIPPSLPLLHGRLMLSPLQAALPGLGPLERLLVSSLSSPGPTPSLGDVALRVVSGPMTPDGGWNLLRTLSLVASPGAEMRGSQS